MASELSFFQIDGNHNVVLRPIGRIERAARARAQCVTNLARRAVAVPGIAETFGGDARELAEGAIALPVHFEAGRNADVKEGVPTG